MLVNINGLKKNVNENLTILQACESQGVTIPHFCYHDKLSIAGNCRMCLVEESKSLKPLASCAVNINSNMQIFTNTELVKKAREGVLEFLLANHPLDCPICDQGGECDLQDQSLVFGGDRGRFYESKRAVEDKNCGPLIKTIMTRCIHCTRCVRFADEIAGTSYMGITGRGSKTEIGFYIERVLNSEVSGNIIDLCPVGALTSKPYAFTARSWELQSFDSIDFFDAINSHIRVDTRGTKVMRILPRVNAHLNEDWISDKIRFVYDSLKYQRLTSPMIRQNNSFVKVSWLQAFSEIKLNLEKYKNICNINGISGPFSDLESISVMKYLLNSLGSSSLNNNKSSFISKFNSDLSGNYLFNFKNSNIEEADLCFLIGTNVRLEAPVLNIKLRKLFLKGVNIYNLGFNFKSNYYIKSLGNNPKTLLQILEGSHWFSSKISRAKKPLIIIGSSFFERNDCISSLVPFLKEMALKGSWNGFGILPTNSGIINALDLGAVPGIHGQANGSWDLNIVLGSSSFLNTTSNSNKKSFNVYIGHHGDSSISNAHVVLPSASPFEKSGSYINVFGSVQKTKAIFFGLDNLKSDWEILKSLSKYLGLDVSSVEYSNNHLNFANKISPVFLSKKISYSFLNGVKGSLYKCKSLISNSMFSAVVTNFYKTDAMASSSKILSMCSSSFNDEKRQFNDN